MRPQTHLIGIHATPELVAEVDRHLGRGHPGDAGYFATRSDLMRCALRHFLARLDDANAPEIRQRTRSVQHVAAPANA